MLARRMILRRLIVSVALSVLLFAASAATALAVDSVADFEKSSSGGTDATVDVPDPIDFAVVKQATAAVVWTKYLMTVDQQNSLTSIITQPGYDASLATVHSNGKLYYTDLLDFTFNSIMGNDANQYATRVTVNSDKTVLTIIGAYSHYDVGNYVPEGGDPQDPGGGTDNPGGGTDNPGGGTDNPGGGTGENPGGGTGENPGGGTGENPGGGTGENPGGGTGENPGGGTGENPGGGTNNGGNNGGNGTVIPLGAGTDEEVNAIPLGVPHTGGVASMAGIALIAFSVLAGSTAILVHRTKED